MRTEWIFLGLLALANALYAQNLPSKGKSVSPEMVRYQEDYSFLANQDSIDYDFFLQNLKFIPLSRSAATYLTLGGETRQLYENLILRYYEARTPDARWQSRVMLHADLHLGKHWRFFTQPASAMVPSKVAFKPPIHEDQLFFLNNFIQYKTTLGANNTLEINVGRQEFELGSARLIALRETNVRGTNDGIRVKWQRPQTQWQAIYIQPLENRPGVLDNPFLSGNIQLWGLYAQQIGGRWLPQKLDAYYLGYYRRLNYFHQNTAGGEEMRHAFGLRWWGKNSTWDYDLEGIYQIGTFNDAAINAYAASANVGYTVAWQKAALRFGLKSEYFSGDKNPNDATLQTFNAFLPNLGYFRGAATLIPANFLDVHPSVTLFYNKVLSAEVDWNFYWKAQASDGLYGPQGIVYLERPIGLLLPPDATDDRRYLGNQIDIRCFYNLNTYIQLAAIYSHFFAEPYVKDHPSPQERGTFITTFVNFKF